jgi:hypothetical protein
MRRPMPAPAHSHDARVCAPSMFVSCCATDLCEVRFASRCLSCVLLCRHDLCTHSMLPRYGFLETSGSAAYLGPGPGKKTSARLAYGPGPGGSFDVFCAAGLAYDLPPLHVYKERSTSFTIPPPPRGTSPPPYKPPVFRPSPVWADRLCMTPGQAAQFKKDGAMTWKGTATSGLQRPNSAAALISRMPKTKSSENLLKGINPEARIGLGCCGIYILPPPSRRRPGTADKFKSTRSGFSSPAQSPGSVMTASPGFGKLTR